MTDYFKQRRVLAVIAIIAVLIFTIVSNYKGGSFFAFLKSPAVLFLFLFVLMLSGLALYLGTRLKFQVNELGIDLGTAYEGPFDEVPLKNKFISYGFSNTTPIIINWSDLKEVNILRLPVVYIPSASNLYFKVIFTTSVGYYYILASSGMLKSLLDGARKYKSDKSWEIKNQTGIQF